MAKNKPVTRGPAQPGPVPSGPVVSLSTDSSATELPSPQAELEISFGADRWGSARGRVPPDQAHHLITTFSIVSITVSGLGGAALALRIAPHTPWVALAELTFALVAVVLTTICGLRQARRSTKRP